MRSTVVKHLEPEFEPVAVVWSDNIPEDALEFKGAKYDDKPKFPTNRRSAHGRP